MKIFPPAIRTARQLTWWAVSIGVLLSPLSVHAQAAQDPEPFPRRVGDPVRTVQDTQPGAPGRPTEAGYWRPLVEAVGLNVFVWSINRYIKDAEWAKVTPETWWSNLNNGWDFDDNAFQANQIAHPYHGGLFFASGRAAGYDFWASAPVAFIGSFTWEYFAETYQPSFNDWINTSVGGIALGEALWRFSEAMLDDRDKGMSRFWREFGATAVSPMRGFNRLIEGKMWHVDEDYIPIRPQITARATVGARSIGDPRDYGSASIQPIFRLRLDYGDDLSQFDGRPFDSFLMRLQLNGQDTAALGLAEVSGRLWAKRSEKKGITLRQWFVYNNYTAYELGAQSVIADFDWLLGSEKNRFRISTGPIVTILGAVKAENVLLPPLDEGYRDYDYGPGAGLKLGASWWQPSGLRLDGGFFLNYVHSINGSSGEHLLQRGEGDLSIPVWNWVRANAGVTYYRRNSYYDLDGDVTVQDVNLELRFGLGTEF